jgi:hypothetical protein
LRCDFRRKRRSQTLGPVVVHPERGWRPLEPRTALRLLQRYFQTTTHGHARERSILALDRGCLVRVSLAPQTCACCAKEASCSSSTSSKTGPAFLGRRRTTCKPKRRAKVALVCFHIPEGALSRFVFGATREASSFARQMNVVQSPSLLPSSTLCHRCGIRCRAEVSARLVDGVGDESPITTFDPHQPEADDATPSREG